MSEGRTFDFSSSGWGWAIHMPHIMKREIERTLLQKLLRKPKHEESYLTCMGHSTPLPYEGDVLLIPMQSGKLGRWKIAEIEWLGNPRDMFSVKRANFDGYDSPAIAQNLFNSVARNKSAGGGEIAVDSPAKCDTLYA